MKKVKQNKLQIIDSTFRNEFEIGKGGSDWTCDYNEKQSGRITDN